MKNTLKALLASMLVGLRLGNIQARTPLKESRVNILNKTGKDLHYKVKSSKLIKGKVFSGVIAPGKEGLLTSFSSQELGVSDNDDKNKNTTNIIQLWFEPTDKHALKITVPASKKAYISVEYDPKSLLSMKVYPQTGKVLGLFGTIKSGHSKKNQVKKTDLNITKSRRVVETIKSIFN